MKSFKKVTILLSILVLTVGCSFDNYIYEEEILAMIPLDEFETKKDVTKWVYGVTEYKSDYDSRSIDYWQSPHETLNRKTGDCEDKALLTIYIINLKFNEKLEIGIYQSNSDGSYHAEPYDKNIDVTFGFLSYAYTLVDTYSYDRAMNKCTRYNSRGF